MARNRDIKRTIGDTEFGSSMKDVADGDFDRGYFDAGPTGNYEGELDPTVVHDWSGDEIERLEGGDLHPGHVEPDMYRETHGENREYGFVRRPEDRGNVERN